MIRSYVIHHAANQKKIDELRAMVNPWRSAMTLIKQEKISQLRTTGRTQKLLKPYWDSIDCGLFTRRQYKSMESQVDASLAAWRGAAIDSGRRFIHNLGVDKDTRHTYFTSNKAGRFTEVPGLWDYVVSQNPFPVYYTTSTLYFDGAVISTPKNTDTDFDWITLRGLHGKQIDIPVVYDPFYLEKAQQADKVSSSLRVSFHDDGSMTLHRSMEFPTAKPRTKGKTIGIDWGLVNAITISDGRRLGSELYQWLRKIDTHVTNLSKDLQRRGIKLRDSKRFRRFQHRISETFRNVLGRILGELSREDVKTIVVESLNFSGGLSRRLNRIITRSGRGVIRSKMESLSEETGIEVVQVNPAYTSQECQKCHYVDRRNRRGERFSCIRCGFSSHADVNAAVNIKYRHTSGKFSRFDSGEKIKMVLHQMETPLPV